MFIEALIIGLIIGMIIKGRIANLFSLNIRGWYLIVVGALIQYVPVVLSLFKIQLFNYNFFTIIGNVILFLALIINIEIKGVFIILVGGIINLFGFVLNGFQMPVLQSQASKNFIQLVNGNDVINYKLISEISNWKYYFGKIISMPDIYPFHKALSFGDIVITIGLIVLVSLEMKKTYFRGSDNMLRFPHQL